MSYLSSIRVKVTRACDHCKKRKIKCDGDAPCYQCTRLQKHCEYNAEYNRGRDPALRVSPPSNNTHTAQNLPEILTNSSSIYSLQPPVGIAQAGGNGDSTFRRIEDSFHRNVDTPLPPSLSLFLLPPEETGKAMVEAYFSTASLTFLHQPTVESWLYDLYTAPHLHLQPSSSGPQNASILTIFAIAQSHLTTPLTSKADKAIHYFLAAEKQLRTGSSEIRLIDVQVRVLQCFFLLSRSRIHHCWSVFGSAVNLLFALGVQRKERVDGQNFGDEVDDVEVESRKRTFWVVYTLDKYLSFALGRPQMIRDEDVDQDLPSLTSSSFRDAKTFNLQVRLSRLLAQALNTLYTLTQPPLTTRLSHAARLTHSLSLWHADLSLLPNTRNTTTLRLAYAQALILVHRNFLLSPYPAPKTYDGEVRSNVQTCLDAAMSITKMLAVLFEEDVKFCAYWFPHYLGYCAVVILYVYVLQQHRLQVSEGIWRPYLEAAEGCQQKLRVALEGEAFAHRCTSVLVELREEVNRELRKREMEAGGNGERGRGLQAGPPGWHGLAGIGDVRAGSVMDRIDRWGFSSLTGY